MENNPDNYKSLQQAIGLLIFIGKIIIIILVVCFCLSGIFTLEKDESAFVMRLGTIKDYTQKQGLSFALPQPIDQIIKVSKRPKRLENKDFMYPEVNQKKKKKLKIAEEIDPVKIGYLLTKDKSIIHITGNLVYQIANPRQTIIENKDAVKQLKLLFNSTLVKAVSNKNLKQIFNKKIFSQEIKQLLQNSINSNKLSFNIINLDLQIYYPKQVKSNYNAVQKQKNETLRIIAKANTSASKIYTQAENEAFQIVNQAKTYKTNLIEKTKSSLQSLKQLQKRYHNLDDTTKQLILYKRLAKLLAKVKQTFVIPKDHKELRININKPYNTQKKVENENQ